MPLVLATLLSAALMWASFPPLNLGFLVFVAPAPLLWALRRVRSPQEAGWLGFLFGFTFFGAMLWWIFILGAVAWIPLTSVMALYATAYAVMMYAVREWSPLRWWFVAVGGWALWELIRARFPLGGFPWGSVGIPIGTLPGTRSAGQWIGASGWGVLVVGFAAALVLMTEEEKDRRPLEAMSALILVLTIAGAFFTPDAGGPQVRTAIVQGNSPCPRVHCENEKQLIYGNHLALTTLIERDSVDLIVWPEDSFGGSYNPTFNPEVASEMAGEAVRIGSYLLAGGSRSGDPGRWENYNVLFSPEGRIIGEYLKRHGVPFGEYVPLRALFEFIPQLAAVPRDLDPGDGPVVFEITADDGEGVLGSVISFEGAFSRYARSEVMAGAELLVVATNEGSYGQGPASDQLIGMVRMMAVSLGVDVVHAAVTGRSVYINANGAMSEHTDLFTEGILYGTVQFQKSRRTFYAVAGDWLQFAAIGAGVIAVAGMFSPQRGFKIRPERRR